MSNFTVITVLSRVFFDTEVSIPFLKYRTRLLLPPLPASSYLEWAAAASWRVEHVALLPHALDVPYAVGDHGQVHGAGARGPGLLVLPLRTGKNRTGPLQETSTTTVLWRAF